MVKNKVHDLFSISNLKNKKLLMWLINLLILSSIPSYIFIYATEQSWQMIVFAGLGSIFGGIMVSSIVFGGQLSNKYCSPQALDSICKWGIIVLYIFLLFLLFLYYLPMILGTLTKPNLGGVIFLFIFYGMLIGLLGVKKANNRRIGSGQAKCLKI